MDSMKLLKPDSLDSMSSTEIQQFMSKLVRAIYISPKLFTTISRTTTLEFIEHLNKFIVNKKPIDLPISNIADFAVICLRFNLNPNVISNSLSTKVRELLKENPEQFEKISFSNLANIILSYNGTDQTS
jgi:hypothetical protein